MALPANKFQDVLEKLIQQELEEEKNVLKLFDAIFEGEDISQNDRDMLIHFYSKLVHDACYENWSLPHLKDAVKKALETEPEQAAFLTDDYVKVLYQVWQSKRDSIHTTKVQQSHFSNKSNTTSNDEFIRWRVDQLTSTKELNDSSQAVAIVELNLKQSSKIVFEVDRGTLANIVKEFDTIQKRIEALSI